MQDAPSPMEIWFQLPQKDGETGRPEFARLKLPANDTIDHLLGHLAATALEEVAIVVGGIPADRMDELAYIAGISPGMVDRMTIGEFNPLLLYRVISDDVPETVGRIRKMGQNGY